MIIYYDGRYLPDDQAKVSVFDHGFLYGDGVFEGIRAYNGRIFRLKEHIDRLYDSAQTIDLHPPISKEEMTEAICETLRRNNLRDAYIRPIITRGVGDLGLDPRKCLVQGEPYLIPGGHRVRWCPRSCRSLQQRVCQERVFLPQRAVSDPQRQGGRRSRQERERGSLKRSLVSNGWVVGQLCSSRC